jgi:cellulose synthase/poly-beta-1,6-N-acetylglucosamine synthase-like glycosyltransferase
MSLWFFWGAVALIVFTYVVFPVLLFVRGLLARRPYQTADIEPSVSMIIAAYNEAAGISTKLDNVLSLDYPADQFEVVIASDGSEDDTVTIVSRYTDRRVRLLALPRQGKAGALNAAVAASTGEILVFSDANSLYAPDAVRVLVRPFASPEVGGVAGNQRYLTQSSARLTSDGERGYWSFDRKLKVLQSRGGNAISATGAIYAIRRSLFQPIPEGVTDDFITSTRVIAQGYRLVFAPDAVAYEPIAQSREVEFGRKVRIITRGLQGVLVMRELLNPFRYGFYAFQLFWHKVLRRLMYVPFVVLLTANPFLWEHEYFYKVTLGGQVAFYACAVLGMALAQTRIGHLKLFTIPFYFCMIYLAAAVATWNVVRGRRITRWRPQRQEALR